VAIVRLPVAPERLPLYFLASLGPFLLAGMALAMLFDLERARVGRVYLADLLGASVGALVVTVLLARLGGESAVLAAALAPAVGAALIAPRLRGASALIVALLLAALFTNGRMGLFRIRSAPAKGLYQHLAETPGTQIALTGWNAYSRIDAVTGFAPPLLARLYIDSDAWTNVLAWDGRVESVRSWADWFRALPFRVAPPAPRTLVIGPGGGSDVVVALAAGSRTVTAVEMNPLMLRFVRHFGSAAGDLYDDPRVETVLSEGRTFVRRSERRFDVILLGFVDSWAAVASGGLSLSENQLYTVEAFRAYLERLSPDGVLVILRWDVDVPRLVTNTVALLGAQAAGERVAVVLERRGTPREPPQMAFLLKKTAFTPQETAAIAAWQLARPVIVPGRHVEEPYAGLLDGRLSLDRFVAEAPSRVDPVTDDRPFFFAQQKPWGLPASMRRAFLQILLPLVALCLALVARGRPAGQPALPFAASVAYFACLGLGFIAVELVLLHHLTLLLGHPIFTLSILLFSLLAAGGFGAGFSQRFAPGRACVTVALVGLAYAATLPLAVPLLLPLPLAARIALAILLVAPLGFAMGIPFPRGLALTGRGALPAPPFYWGLNGIFSVVGSLATMVAAVVFGFTTAFVAGCGCYLVAALAAGGFGSADSKRAG
jgi:hypothetical protein